jgi:DNA (cytosine-5)-methyltransferase 1
VTLALEAGLALQTAPASANGLRVVSLYSGAGGMDVGFAAAGFTPIWANDVDPFAVETFNANIPGGHAVAGDIDRAELLLPAPEEVDVVIGGPPCQGFSVAGHMRTDDPRSRHVWKFLSIVERLRPSAFVMENVAALAVNRRWSQLIVGLETRARQLGYRAETFVLDASHHAVPQSRQRMFLVGVKDGDPLHPEPTTRGAAPTVAGELRRLPPYGAPGNDALCTARVTPAKNPVLRRSPYAGLLLNGKGRVLDLGSPALTLPASMGGNRTPIIDQTWLEGGYDWISKYHDWLWRGGAPVRRIPARMRRLTVQEAAALQTFPRGYGFVGRQTAQFRQIGNAVPPMLAFHVAQAVAAALDVGDGGIGATAPGAGEAQRARAAAAAVGEAARPGASAAAAQAVGDGGGSGPAGPAAPAGPAVPVAA